MPLPARSRCNQRMEIKRFGTSRFNAVTGKVPLQQGKIVGAVGMSGFNAVTGKVPLQQTR